MLVARIMSPGHLEEVRKGERVGAEQEFTSLFDVSDFVLHFVQIVRPI